jgi:autotransporter-associated beta strand protein
MKIRKAHHLPALAAICMVMSGAASATPQYWDGSVSTANGISDNNSADPMNWLSGGNWDNGATSGPIASWTNGDTAIFGGTFSGTQTVTLDSGIILGDGTTIGGAGSSYLISVTGTGYNQFGPISGTITIQAGSTLSADAAFNNAHNLDTLTLNGGTLTSINGPAGPANDGTYGNWIVRGVTVGGSSLSTISSTTLQIVSGSFDVADAVAGPDTDLLVSAKIIAPPSGIQGDLTKTGGGTMELTGANTYTTATTVSNGTLLVSGSNGSLGTGAIQVDSGGTLEFSTTGSKTVASNISGSGAIIKNGSGADRYSFSGDNSGFTGTYTQTGAETGFISATAGSAGASWVINGAWFTTNIGTATLKLGALSGSANHWNDSTSGTTTLEVGEMGTDTTFSGIIGFGEVGSITALTKTGAGTLTLTGANTYAGPTAVNMGTLALVGGSQASPVTVASGASLGFTLGSPTTSSSSFNLTDGTVKITGTPTLPSYTLITSSSGITGTPTLDAPISGYALTVEGGTSLKLVQTAGYSSWMAPFITGGLTGDTTPGGDPENDGMTNLLEYALNGNPSISDPSIQPDLVVTATDFEFTYSRLDLSLADTTQTFEYGSNLTGWTPVLIPAGPGVEIPVGAAKVTIINTGTTDSVTISIPKSVSPSGNLFGRLKVVAP